MNIWSQTKQNHLSCQIEYKTEADTWIFPSIQMGPFNIKHDSDLTENFLKSGAEGSRFKFATGYFNLTNEYKNVMLNSSKASFDVLCAHPTANGFLG